MKPIKKIKKMLLEDSMLLATLKEQDPNLKIGLAARVKVLVDVLNVIHDTNKSFEYWLKEAIHESRN